MPFKVHIIVLVINSLGGRDRQTDTNIHTNFMDKSNFKKAGVHWPKAWLQILTHTQNDCFHLQNSDSSTVVLF